MTQNDQGFITIYQKVFGETPSSLVSSGFVMESLPWAQMTEKHQLWVQGVAAPDMLSRELWPLISHHQSQNDTNPLRGLGLHSGARLNDHVVTHLLLSHGLVIADPLMRPLAHLDVAERHDQAIDELAPGDSLARRH